MSTKNPHEANGQAPDQPDGGLPERTIRFLRAKYPDRFAALETAPVTPAGAESSTPPAAGLAVPRAAGTTPYARRALEMECARLAGCPSGGRNDAANKAAFAVYQLVAGGELDEGEADAALRAAAEACGLSASEAAKTLRSGAESGKKEPRTAPKDGPGEEIVAPEIEIAVVGGKKGKAIDETPPPSHSRANAQPSENGRPNISEADDDPHRLARECRKRIERDVPGSLRHWRETWYIWRGGLYIEQSKGEIQGVVTGICKKLADEAAVKAMASYMKSEGKATEKPKPFAVGTKLVGDVLNALRSMCLLGSKFDAPGWLTSAPEPVPVNSDFIPCFNGLLAIPRVATAGDVSLLPHTPEYFAFGRLDFGYSSDAPEPVAWKRFLADLWGDDQACIDSLQEWLGYLLTSDTSAQKILVMIGPPRSGKGTVLRIINALIGSQNCGSTSLTSLCGSFGLAGLVGKSVAIISDARLSNRTDPTVALERLISISGEDEVPINRKNKEEISARMPLRFVIATNELPRFVDASTAITSRCVVLPLTKSFLGREDTRLYGKLAGELPSILRWALEGLRRLRERGHFTQPDVGSEHIEDWQDMVSPVREFVVDRCFVEPKRTVHRSELYDDFKRWCEAEGKHCPAASVFGRDLNAAYPGQIKRSQPQKNGRRGDLYVGIALRHQMSVPVEGADASGADPVPHKVEPDDLEKQMEEGIGN